MKLLLKRKEQENIFNFVRNLENIFEAFPCAKRVSNKFSKHHILPIKFNITPNWNRVLSRYSGKKLVKKQFSLSMVLSY